MQKNILDLGGSWRVRSLDGKFDLTGTVPGSFFYDLEKSGYWGERDVFFRENNRQCLAIADRDFVYERAFHVPEDFFAVPNRIYLEAEGLDTIAEIQINDATVARTENMFRRFQFEVRSFLRTGENRIAIFFANTVAEIARRHARRPLWNPEHTLDGAVHLRKNHCSFGWDWGPIIPDLGIWRPLRLRAYAGAKLKDFHLTQRHDNGTISLEIFTRAEQWSAQELTARLTITAPDQTQTTHTLTLDTTQSFVINNPQLWWPNGYGAQPLYTITCELMAQGEVLDQREQRLGLRTLALVRKPDEHGESFYFTVNDVPIFARGANYIPEDVYLTRPMAASTERLIRAAVAANFNCLRVWGGGVYPSDEFYNLCDRYGLLVWQDLMFACGVYDIHNPAFVENITAEVRDNLQRIRHHACLALICGNNEMEWGFEEWDFPKTKEMRTEYLKQYEILFPQLAREVCAYVPYWPASPSSGGNFDEPNAEHRGDVHYWLVWHGNKPFTEFRKHYFRFLSEFGFESFPSLKTVATFTQEEDRNVFSPVLEDHQRCAGGNGKILNYLAQYFRYPKDFEALLYVSQLSQAEAMRYAVEHMRRHRGRCMGATYWQFNDNWPVASWSSVDYFGRWKALQYVAKRMYDQILVSCEEQATSASIHLSNENTFAVAGTLRWQLLSFPGQTLRTGEMRAQVGALSSVKLVDLNFSQELHGRLNRERYLSYSFIEEESRTTRHGAAVFAPYKQLSLANPHLQATIAEQDENFVIYVSAKSFAKFVRLDLKRDDAIFSDNYFDLDAGQTRAILVARSSIGLADLREQLVVSSLFESY